MKSIQADGAKVQDYARKHFRYINTYKEVFIDSFESLTELDNYNESTPFNKHFAASYRHESVDGSKSFTGTDSYEQARDYMLNGWHTEAAKLNANLKIANRNKQLGPTKKRGYSVVGYAPSVPRYLMGLPTSMVNQIKVIGRDKVITVVKSLNYGAAFETYEIERESIKALQIVQNLEAAGYSVNLYVFAMVGGRNGRYSRRSRSGMIANGCLVRIKRAGERLNISKLAYPMVNPSMKRRNIFAWRERAPHIPRSFVADYGSVISDYDTETILRSCWDDKVIYLPAVISENLAKIRDVNELDKRFNIR